MKFRAERAGKLVEFYGIDCGKGVTQWIIDRVGARVEAGEDATKIQRERLDWKFLVDCGFDMATFEALVDGQWIEMVAPSPTSKRGMLRWLLAQIRRDAPEHR